MFIDQEPTHPISLRRSDMSAATWPSYGARFSFLFAAINMLLLTEQRFVTSLMRARPYCERRRSSTEAVN